MIGGSVGAALRYGAGLAIGSGGLATLLVNLIGSFALGLLSAGLLPRPESAESALWLLFGVGCLGAFTTFSAFSRETTHMLMQHEYLQASLYVLANLIGSVGLFIIGFAGMRNLLT